jgi:hypothetical protein
VKALFIAAGISGIQRLLAAEAQNIKPAAN